MIAIKVLFNIRFGWVSHMARQNRNIMIGWTLQTMLLQSNILANDFACEINNIICCLVR